MDNKLLDKLKDKKGVKPLDPTYKNAKMSMLAALHDEMKGMLGNDLKGHQEGLHKLTIAAKDQEGLKEGLEKAEEMLSGQDSGDMNETSEEAEEENEAEQPGHEESGEESEGDESEEDMGVGSEDNLDEETKKKLRR